MAWYDNIDRRGYGTQPLMDYGSNQLAEYGNQNLGNNRYRGLQYGQQYFEPEEVVDETVTGINYPNLGNPLYPPAVQPRVPDWISSPNRPAFQDETGFLSKITGPVMGGLQWLGDKFKRSPQKQAEYDAIMGSRDDQGWGTYKGDSYNIQDSPSGLKVYSELDPHGYNFQSFGGSKSLKERDQKKIDWALGRIDKFKDIGEEDDRGISKRLFNTLIKRGVIDESGNRIITPSGADNIIDKTTVTGKPFHPGQGTTRGGTSTYRGPPTKSFDPGLDRAMGGQRPSTSGGFTNPGAGSYGPWKAEGGRVGYQEGELVEDEYMAEATPRGMMEENIEEVQGEPSREQLEAIALEIFRLPLEELNEEQLNVVYQAAMEQQPAEEEVQFAAQEGPGEGIASLV